MHSSFEFVLGLDHHLGDCRFHVGPNKFIRIEFWRVRRQAEQLDAIHVVGNELAPVDLETAIGMIGEIRALKSVAGLRGQEKGDLLALAQAISALSRLALRSDLGVWEAEINPMLVLADGKGVVAVDALIRRCCIS